MVAPAAGINEVGSVDFDTDLGDYDSNSRISNLENENNESCSGSVAADAAEPIANIDISDWGEGSSSNDH